ncbi:MAG: hypothetical protein ACTHNN_10505 [Xanthobacteraceae bacterium]
MHQCYRPLRLFAAKSAAPAVAIVAALLVHAVPDWSASASQATASSVDKTITSPVLDAIDQNTRGESEGYAVGVPGHFAWCGGSYAPPGNGAPPSDFSAVTGWAQVYPEVGSPQEPNPDANIMVANAKTYVRRRATHEWLLVQDQTTDDVAGGHYAADFGARETRQITVRELPNGTAVLPGPTAGFNTHFWLTRRGAYEAGSIDGVYVQMDMKTDTPNKKLVANVGADWWRNPTAVYVSGFANNPGAGMSNWIELSTEWSTLRFYSGSAADFQTSPPPQLAGPMHKAASAIVRHHANGPAPCFARP